jgi:hypothetical protein
MTTPRLEQSDPFFMDDVSVIVSPQRITEFFPTQDMTIEERMNALARLTIYSTLALSLYRNSVRPMHYGAVLIVVLVLLWKNQTLSKTQHFTLGGLLGQTEPVILPEKVECRMPTFENPMMNNLYGDPVDSPPACRGPGVQEAALALLDKQLIEDPEDLFGKKQMQRNFYTLPSTTIVSDRERFQNALFKDAPNCKVDGNACFYDDLRRNRDLPVTPENDYSELPTLSADRII